MPNKNEEQILVIGAGPAGLAVSACLRQQGLQHTVLERAAAVGSAWRGHYDRLHLHTTKGHSALPYSPWPVNAPRYPSRQAVVDYLEGYARQHEIHPVFGTEVLNITQLTDGLCVSTNRGEYWAKHVVMACGYNRIPHLPQFPGLKTFEGSVVHARQYKHALAYQGQRTLVVGCGNSGAEIALDLAEHGVDVSMVVRGPVHVAPRDLFGRPAQGTNILLSRLPLGLRDVLASAALRLAVGDLSRWGIVRPHMGPNRMIEEMGRVPILDIGTIAMVKAGRIQVCPGVHEVLPGQVRFADGSLRPLDAIVLATGYRPGLGELIDGFDAISDARGRPHRFGAETGIPGLYFVGYRNPVTGALREMALEAPRVAKSIHQAISQTHTEET